MNQRTNAALLLCSLPVILCEIGCSSLTSRPPFAAGLLEADVWAQVAAYLDLGHFIVNHYTEELREALKLTMEGAMTLADCHNEASVTIFASSKLVAKCIRT
jgi:hypothetical protein